MDKIDGIQSDIKTLKIQGATNVALAVLKGIKLSQDQSLEEIRKIALKLAFARPTEPLAQNAVRFIFGSDLSKDTLIQKISLYEQYIREAKSAIISQSSNLVENGGVYLTHCHSSTAVSIFKIARENNRNFSVYVTETRPLYQGRITAKELIDAGIENVTFLIDDAVFSLINKLGKEIKAIFIGADLLTDRGFVNKVGSLPIASVADNLHIPVYSFTTLLKYNPGPYDEKIIEKRSGQEIWNGAPPGLSFFAPAFDFVPYFDNVSLVTEDGIIRGKEVRDRALRKYPFIKD